MISGQIEFWQNTVKFQYAILRAALYTVFPVAFLYDVVSFTALCFNCAHVDRPRYIHTNCNNLQKPLRFSNIAVLTPDPLAGFHTTFPVVVVTVCCFRATRFSNIYGYRAFYSLANYVSTEDHHELGNLFFKF